MLITRQSAPWNPGCYPQLADSGKWAVAPRSAFSNQFAVSLGQLRLRSLLPLTLRLIHRTGELMDPDKSLDTYQGFAILAPVPLIHLESAITITSQPYVSFGSMKSDLFRAIDQARGARPVLSLIYPSHNEDRAQLSYKVSWVGWYI